MYLGCLHMDMTKYCRCDPSISEVLVYYSHVDDSELTENEYAFSSEGKLWSDPQWKVLPSRLCSFLAHFAELVPRRDMRQNFLVEDLLGQCVAPQCFWTVVLSVHACCKTCIMLRLLYQCH